MRQRFDVGSKVYSSQYGAGEVLAVEGAGDAERLTIRFERAGERQVLSAFSVLEPLENQELPPTGASGSSGMVGRAVPSPAPLALDDLRQAVREAMRQELGTADLRLVDRWKGGTLILKPGKPGQKEKEIPIDEFFHKIVMVRDRLRVLEQKLNSHPVMSDAEKVELQQYVTRIYGSLTTFNILFADRDDWFVGQKGD